MNIANTANVGELLWVAIGLCAGTVNTVLWVIAIRDLRAVYNARQNGAKRIEAWTWFYAHLFLVLMQCAAVSIGLYAALTPPANPERPMTTVGIVASAGLITMQLLHCLLGIFLIQRRGKLDAYLDGKLHAGVLIPVDSITVQQAVDLVDELQEADVAQGEQAAGGIPDD